MKTKTLLFILLLTLASCTKPAEHIVPQAPPGENNAALFPINEEAIETQELEYTPGARGFLARPKAAGKHPAVIMIHEWWGLNDNIKTMAKSLASEGYIVLAVDLYNGEITTDRNRAAQLTTRVNENQARATENMQAAYRFLKQQDYANGKIAAIGWCFGGGMSLQLSLSGLNLDATIIYYGHLETKPETLKRINWPVLGIFGEKDTSIPLEQVRQFEQALNSLGIENEIYTYPERGHAFANPSGPNFATEDTKDAWQKTLNFLNKHLILVKK